MSVINQFQSIYHMIRIYQRFDIIMRNKLILKRRGKLMAASFVFRLVSLHRFYNLGPA